MNFMKILPAALIILVLSSCSPLTPFTQNVREQYKLNENDLKNIQFYVSHDIILKRGEVSENEKSTESGTLTVLSGQKVEEVVIKKGTPCLIDKVIDGNRVSLMFDDGPSNYLVFGSLNRRDGYYTLMALDWVGGRGKLNYGEKTYYAAKESNNIYLNFKLKSLQKYQSEQRVVKGKKL